MKGYKTIAFNIIMSVLMVFTLWDQESASEFPTGVEVQGLLDQAEAWITAVWAAGNVLLRSITTTAVFKKE